MRQQRVENSASLRRGSACLSCRKRKLKCDGLRPVCQQCVKMKRMGECEYDDSRLKSRTRLLREKMASLEERVRELEAEASGYPLFPSYCSSPEQNLLQGDTSIPMNAPQSHPSDNSPSSTEVGRASSSSSSSYSSPSSIWQEDSSLSSMSPLSLDPLRAKLKSLEHASANPLGYELDPITSSRWEPVAGTIVASSPDQSASSWDTSQPLPYETHKYLLDTFIAHRAQCCFYSNVNRLDISLPKQSVNPPHAALMNAMYLLACHFAQSPLVSELEPLFLTQTLHEIGISLHESTHLLDVVAASCLLAVYYYFHGRTVEGYRHSFAATRLAVSLKLHQVCLSSSDGYNVTWNALGNYDVDEKIAVFWQVYTVDRCWTAANGLLSAIPDEKTPSMRITTPLPTVIPDHLNMITAASNSPIYNLFDPDTSMFNMFSLSTSALKALAAGLFEKTSQLTSAMHKDTAFWIDHRVSDVALQRIQFMLLPFPGRDSWRMEAPLLDTELFVVHTMIQVSVINLQMNELNHTVSSWAANTISQLISQLHEIDYQFLDPIISVCWCNAARNLLRRQRCAWDAGNVTEDDTNTVAFINHCIDVIVAALRTLGNYVPLSNDLLTSLEQARGQNFQ